MTKSEIEAALAKAANDLRVAAPDAWNSFMMGLGARYNYTVDQCISSTPELLPLHQGRAREARDLLNELANAPRLAEKLHEHERAKHHGQAR